MKYITLEEFDAMYNQLVESDYKCYDLLIDVSDKVLKKYVYKCCYSDPVLRSGQYEEDIMQEIRLRLLKTCVTNFFCRNGKENYDPEGFVSWLFTVAKNIIYDFAKKVRKYQFNELKGDEYEAMPCHSDLFSCLDASDKLNVAFLVVIDSDIKVYKVLTWLAMMVFMVNLNIKKIEANEVIINTFTDMTLYDMFTLVLYQMNRIPWLSIDKERLLNIKEKLDETQSDTRRLGDMKYSDFYMKKGPKATISDWMNRINKFIVKEEQQV